MRTKSLAFIAGIIWLIAGFNVCRIGVVSWLDLDATTLVMVMGSIVTMILFSMMFVKMLFKNVQRIRKIKVEKRKVWDIMPMKSYVIMAFMITFGVLLRSCQVIPRSFIASFYVGLGSALMMAGIIYISAFLCPKEL
nr:hypothetical protein [uncultured Prevotella sp.]